MFWWCLIVFVLVSPFLFYWFYRWTSSDHDIDHQIAKERFQAEQEWRALRRSGRND
jgi:hypothetical protein